jgi:hypothetical protein
MVVEDLPLSVSGICQSAVCRCLLTKLALQVKLVKLVMVVEDLPLSVCGDQEALDASHEFSFFHPSCVFLSLPPIVVSVPGSCCRGQYVQQV